MPILLSLIMNLQLLILGTIIIFNSGSSLELYCHAEMREIEIFHGIITPEMNTRTIQNAKKRMNAILVTDSGKKAQEAAYLELFGTKPGMPLPIPCDLKKKLSNRKLQLTLDHEWHGQNTANAYKAKLYDQAFRGNIFILSESDMSLEASFDEIDRSIVTNGLKRTQGINEVYKKMLGSQTRSPKNIVGIDDARIRAPLTATTSSDTLLLEIFRNPILRKLARETPGYDQSQLKRRLDLADLQPTSSFENQSEDWRMVDKYNRGKFTK